MDNASIKKYISLWSNLQGIEGVDSAFLADILPYAVNWEDKQIISLSRFTKEKIAKKQCWGERIDKKFKCAFDKLCKQGLLRELDRNVYQVNPSLTGNRHVFRIKKITVKYNLKTGKIETIIK